MSVTAENRRIEAQPGHWLNMLTRKGRWLHLKRCRAARRGKVRGRPSLKRWQGYRQHPAWMRLRRWAKPEFARHWTTMRDKGAAS